MAQCPKCSAAVSVDFGITTCTSCDAILFVDMNGNVQLEDQQGPVAMGFPPPSQERESSPQEIVAPIVSFPQTASTPADPNFSTELAVENATAPDNVIPVDPPPHILTDPQSKPASGDLSEIAKFGNSEVSLGKDGPYIYDILIWNIDSREVRERLREALTDRRFAWDVDKLMNSIQQGALRISQINAVKSAVVVNRLKNLPVGISWEQKLFTDIGS